jgi:vancomycin resistance protein YoaR
MNELETDKLLGELFKGNAPQVNEMVLHERVTARGRQKRRRRPQARRTRALALACASVALAAAIGYGAYSAVAHYQGHPVLVLTDSTVPTTVPATIVAGSTASSTDVSLSPDVQAQIQAQAKLLTSAPLQLTAAGKTFTLSPEEIAAALDYTPWYGAQFPSVPHLSAAKLSAFFARVAPAVEAAAVDAKFDTDGTKVWVVPGTDGTAIDTDWTAVALTAAALTTTARTAAVVTRTKEPDLTTAEAQAMGVKDLLASYTTVYTGPPFRKTNVKVTTDYAGGVFLAPGEQYDFDKQVGPRTAARGFKVALGIVGPGPGNVDDVFAGAITQVSTTLFNAAFFAGLQVVERHNSSIYIAHYPTGLDATVTAGGKDFRFRNDTEHYIWIVGASDGVTTTFRIYGTDDGRKVAYTRSDFYDIVPRTQVTVPVPHLGEGESVATISGQDGRTCQVVRTVTRADGSTTKDVFISLWPMIPKTIEVGAGTSTTTAP